MTKSKFLEIANNVLVPVIDEVAGTDQKFKIIANNLKLIVCDLEQSIHKEYEETKSYFKKNFFIKKKEPHIDRFKIAALLYIAFVKIIKRSKFLSHRDKELKYLFLHRVAFNTAISIIENFIYADKKKHGASYCLYVEKHGIIEQRSKEAQYIIDKLIANHKENRLSEFAVANIFYSIECNSKIRFKEFKKRKKQTKTKENVCR